MLIATTIAILVVMIMAISRIHRANTLRPRTGRQYVWHQDRSAYFTIRFCDGTAGVSGYRHRLRPNQFYQRYWCIALFRDL